ncbi:hypothetical protein RSO01_32430 [Reyranella soli]|uniref:Uncharacterized protein n=1 Tax=Reyranella soli TaxID=1230389 RepID=A0A512NAV3_9HYPH|nr:hypothetical protein RSO01_32430 [Reyranella soli]
MDRLPEEDAREQRGDEGRGTEHQQHVGDRREPQRQDEAHETSGKQHGAREQRKTCIAHVDQHATALQQKQWQH